MFFPTSFFWNQIQIYQFEKKLVGQNMNIWINTPPPPINALATAVPVGVSVDKNVACLSSLIFRSGSTQNFQLYICGNIIFTHLNSCSKKTCSGFFNSSPFSLLYSDFFEDYKIFAILLSQLLVIHEISKNRTKPNKFLKQKCSPMSCWSFKRIR